MPLKHITLTISVTLFLLIFSLNIGCKKEKSPTVIGTWDQSREIKQYTNPFTQKEESDTFGLSRATIEFKSNGEFWGDGIPTGTYQFLNDSTISFGLLSFQYTILSLDNKYLTVRKESQNEWIQVINPSMPDRFMGAPVKTFIIQYRR